MTNFLHDICGNGESRERGVNQRPATRSIILQNQPLVMQRMPAHRIPFSERVIATAKQKERFSENRLTLQIGRGARVDNNAKIHFSLADALQHPLLGAIVQNEIYLRIATVAVGDALRDQMGRKVWLAATARFP